MNRDVERRPNTCDRPVVILSCAVTLDGYLNDRGPDRLELSTPDDRDEVDALRAASDAIVVGAGTIRADNPSLLVRSAARRAARELAGRSPSPMRVVLTRSGRIPADSNVLRDGQAATVVCHATSPRQDADTIASPSLTQASASGPKTLPVNDQRLGAIPDYIAGWIGSAAPPTPASRTAPRVMIEGGQRLSSDVLRLGLADVVRIAIAPFVVGRSSAPRLGGALQGGLALHTGLRLRQVANRGGMAVLWYTKGETPAAGAVEPRTDYEWLAEAIALAERCPASEGAYSVGAIIVSKDGRRVSDGYSRELDEKVHAEEAAIRKASPEDLLGACVYTSMEPCSKRLSGRPPCAELIRAAGVARVVYALKEPPTFVQCEGAALLDAAGIETVHLAELAPYAAAPNKHLIGTAPVAAS